MKTITRLNRLDKRSLAAGLNATVWPFLLCGPMGFRIGIGAGMLCVLLTAAVLAMHDRRRYVGCDWHTHLLTFVPGLVYWSLAIVLHAIFD